MKRLKIVLGIVLISLLSGCSVVSLHPLFTEEDLIFDNLLIGDWQYKEERWSFEKNKNNQYTLIHYSDGEQATFKAHLLAIEGETFLDIYPLDLNSDNYLYRTHLLPVHTFSKIEISEDEVSLRMLDINMFEKAVKQNKIEIDHIKTEEDSILLTAPTIALQKFVLEHLDLFGEALVLNK